MIVNIYFKYFFDLFIDTDIQTLYAKRHPLGLGIVIPLNRGKHSIRQLGRFGSALATTCKPLIRPRLMMASHTDNLPLDCLYLPVTSLMLFLCVSQHQDYRGFKAVYCVRSDI